MKLSQFRRFGLALTLALLTGLGGYALYERSGAPEQQQVSNQTDVDRASHDFDAQGVPYLDIADVGRVRHPAWIAIYALAYGGVEAYEPALANLEDPEKFKASIQWLEENLKPQANGSAVWEYGFDNTYNDISIAAPWSSAFAQATGIQAFLAAYKRTQDEKYLTLAKEAAESLFIPLSQGGFLFEAGDDIWFEEIPEPRDNPSHILNGHMRVLLALRELADVTGNEEYLTWLKRGTETLYRWLPKYDTGYWLRYDLNPKKTDLLFRLANPYGFETHPLAVDKITLRDPLSKDEVVLDVGAQGDGEGANRIAGVDWGAAETMEGRTVRRLKPTALDNAPDQMGPPHSYFYLSLPGTWDNNRRDDWFELIIDYYDDARAHIAVQQRSIAPGQTFHDMRDGDLHLTGAGHWRRWIVPVRPSDLGYWVGNSYAEKHQRYLAQIAEWDERFKVWTAVAGGYARLASQSDRGVEVTPSQVSLPEQTPMLPLYTLDTDGVVMQSMSGERTKMSSSGTYDPDAGRGTPIYSPYVVASQLMSGSKSRYSGVDQHLVRREPALNWLLNPSNYTTLGEAIAYPYRFDNAYNDVAMSAPWPSAFGQAYVLKGLMFAGDKQIGPQDRVLRTLHAAARAYGVHVENGGIRSVGRAGTAWYEEVPNATHVLNAHLVSTLQLAAVTRQLDAADLRPMVSDGLVSLKEHLHRFDTGYWLRYDSNPKKEFLLQLDWLSAENSPLIDEIKLENPQTGRFVRLDVGNDGDTKGVSRVSGLEWDVAKTEDGNSVRGFRNGYVRRDEPAAGGARHNVFMVMTLPDREFSDFFDVPPHRLVIRYKDQAKGAFAVKVQSINDGTKLDFVPLRRGVWVTDGDGQWKEKEFLLRPQDLGWYKGPEYQKYEVQQLYRIANLTNDWFFYQYAERHGFYADVQREGEPSVVENTLENYRQPLTLTYVSGSSTYPAHGYENALDGDVSDNYVAGVEGEQHFVVLDVTPPSDLAALQIHWESEINRSRRVRVMRVDPKSGRVGEVLGDVDGLSGETSLIPLDGAKQVSRFRIEFDGHEGQPRVLLRQIRAFHAGESSKQLQSNSHVFMSATDKRNPLHVFRMPITSNIKALSDRLAAGAASDHEKILKFMEYISTFRVGFASDASPDTTVAERIGACGTFSNTLLALAAAQGIDGRAITLLNWPTSSGHAVAELFIDGKWRLYDPTYGAFYVDRLDARRLPLSFDEIRTAYRNGREVERIATTYRPSLDSFTGRDIFLNANPIGVIGPEHPMIFPLTFDANERTTLVKTEFGTRFQGADFLGAASTNQNQVWTLKNLTPGKRYAFTITPDHLGGELKADDRAFVLTANMEGGELLGDARHDFDFSTGQSEPWKIQFVPNSSSVQLELRHPYRGPDIKYMQVAAYALHLVDH